MLQAVLGNRLCMATTAVAIFFTALLAGAAAEAATRSMVGSLSVINPSVAPPYFIEGGPAILGKKLGPYPPNGGFTTVAVAGGTPSTFVGRQVTLGASKLNASGVQVRDFPAFAGIANLTKSFMTQQGSAVFMEGGGALAGCPGPGCTSDGAGTAISWCPPLAEPVGTPAPGTVNNQVGNWDCPSWPAGAGGGDRFLRLAISNSSGRNRFGGTLTHLRSVRQNTWRVLVQPASDGVAEVSREWPYFVDVQWTPGRPSFQYNAIAGNPGPRLLARLNANGAVSSTLGCVNPSGTPGGTFMVGVPIVGAGSNCGTPTAMKPGVQGWGFPLTTGDIEGSDPFPGLVVTTAVPPGTPFSPNVVTQPASAGFFFTRMGTDRVTGTSRNLVLLGGGVAVDPGSGNSFFRISDLRLSMTVPEPGTALGLVAGASALLAFAGRRRQRRRG